MDAVDLYLSMLKKSILNELYIDNEARLVYYAICAAGQRIPDPVVVREIATRRPEILDKLRDTRTDGRISSFWWEVPFQDGSVQKLNPRNITRILSIHDRPGPTQTSIRCWTGSWPTASPAT